MKNSSEVLRLDHIGAKTRFEQQITLLATEQSRLFLQAR